MPVQAGTTSFVRLNLGVLPVNSNIAKATLRLYVTAVAAPGSFDVYQVDGKWSERGLNFNNAPILGASATGSRPVSVTGASLNQFILIDITPLAQGWLKGSIPNLGLALALASSGGSFSFDSKESVGTGHQPELEVVLDSISGIPTDSTVTSTAEVTTHDGITLGQPDRALDNETASQHRANSNLAPVINPATNFADTTTDQVVSVQQNGTGVALIASAPSSTAIVGASKASPIAGIIAGVEAITAAPTGYGLYARQLSSTAPGVAPTGVYAQSDSPNGAGMRAWEPYASGATFGLVGGAASTGGTAIQATETATSGSTFGLVAKVSSPTGTGALILNNASGTITGPLIQAKTNSGVQFFVDGSGNVNAAGSFSGMRLISTVATGTAPLQVASTTVVPNLNASLLGGIAASAFAPAGGSAAYIQNGSATQTGTSFNIDGNGTVGGTLNSNAVNSATNYQIGSGVVLSVGTTADQNLFLGSGAGTNNTPGSGQGNTFSGYNAGLQNTTGNNNTFNGASAGQLNTTGVHNTYLGMNAGQPVVTGSNNTFLGFNAGFSAGTAANNDVYISNQGAAADNGAIRIGDPANQTSAYIAGVNGSATTAGVPVFVDSTGKLGTGGGSVNFSQVVGTVSSPQFTGTYSNAVTLSNTSNTFNGSFNGNGAGLTGVSSGLSWPIVTKNVDYTIQTSDFSTPTHYGNFIVLIGLVKRTFTLPNPPPPNGSCVGIGNVAQTTGANTYLSVNPNGLNVDGGATAPTHPRRASYLYCSDGTGYWRFGQNQNGVSEIGPWLYTADNGTANVLTTSFLSGLDFGLIHGTMIYLWPANANTSSTPTLNVNQLGAVRIVKFGNQALAPGDLTHTALAHLIFDGNLWQLLNPQTNQGTVTAVTATAPLVSSGGVTPNLSCPTCVTNPILSGTTGSIGGSSLTAGGCTTGTAAVTGATVGHPVSVSASDGTLPNGFIILSAAVTNPNTVTVQLCATASVTPAANSYNVSTQ